MTEYRRFKCFSCNRVIESDMDKNPTTISPAYGGLWFRATGNYGSSVFDPPPELDDEFLQIVICDNCIKRKASRVLHIHNLCRAITADIKPLNPQERHDD